MFISTGTITAALTEQCWGTVQVCTHAGCGGVCAHTWTDANSEMLCKDLGCGHAFTGIDQNISGTVTILAMNPTKHTTNLTESIIVENENPIPRRKVPCSNETAVVVCSGKGHFEELPTLHLEYLHISC